MKFSDAIGVIKRDGFGAVVARRLDWYGQRFRGTMIALAGNKIRMDGMTYSVASPQFGSTLKATLANGHHEREERDLVRRWLPADLPLIELGGGLGVVSCLANSKLADRSQHVVVEANPAMISVLTANRDLNGCGFTVINKALGYDAATISLEIDETFVASSAVGMAGTSSGRVDVPTTSVATVMQEHDFSRVGIVCDIEGMEAELIAREFPVLGDRIAYIMAETHPAVLGRQATDAMLKSLLDMGFVEKERIGDSVFYARD